MSEVAGAVIPALATGVSGAEEEARSIIGTVLAQIITLVRNVINFILEYLRRFLTWAGEHPLATTLFIVNFAVWVS